MRLEDIDFLIKLLKEQSGLVLTPEKAYLLESRLMPVARKNNFATLDDLVMALRGKNDKLLAGVVDAMTTNESFFFRDIKPFEQFKTVILPMLIKERAGAKTIRIWSAACSSGQEPYSLAMILHERAAELQGWHINIIGTDLSHEILTKAKEGKYSQFEVQRGLPIQMLVKHFTKIGDDWVLNDSIRRMVDLREGNLLKDFTALGRFDVVFCRNVLIYLDQKDKEDILNRISAQMAPDGFLFLGGAETVLGITTKFAPVPNNRGMYALSAAGSGSAKIGAAPAPAPAPAVAPPVAPAAAPIPPRPAVPQPGFVPGLPIGPASAPVPPQPAPQPAQPAVVKPVMPQPQFVKPAAPAPESSPMSSGFANPTLRRP